MIDMITDHLRLAGGFLGSYARDLRPLAAIPLDVIFASAPYAASEEPPAAPPVECKILTSEGYV